MAGSLIKIDEEIVTSAVASVTLTGIDSTYDVYMVACNNIFFDTNDDMRIRFTVSGSADTSANYDYAHKAMYADTAFGNTGITNATSLDTNQSTGTSSNFQINTIMYLFNFNNASEYSFVTYENANRNTTQSRTGLFAGGGVLTVAQATDGVTFFLSSSANIAGGTFTLYGLKK